MTPKSPVTKATDIQGLVDEGLTEDWIDFQNLELSADIEKQRTINSLRYPTDVKVVDRFNANDNDAETDDESYAEYINAFLNNSDEFISIDLAKKILKTIGWITKEFQSSYVISLTEYTFSTKVNPSDLKEIIVIAEDLESSFEDNLLQQWRNLVIDLREQQASRE